MSRPDPLHSRDSSLPEPAPTFNGRKRQHFENLLREKWECPEPGHTICVPTEDHHHFQLLDVHLAEWVDALCTDTGAASTSQPPEALFERINDGPVWNTNDGTMSVKAVRIAPSRRHGSLRTPTITSTKSFNGTRPPTSTWSSWSSGAPSSVSSGVPGPGYYGGKAIKWLGEKGLNVVQDAVIMKRANGHVARLKKWEKRDVPRLGAEEMDRVFEMLGDALEMSRPCYPARVNNIAYKIGRGVQLWLQDYPSIPQTRATSLWLIQVQICLIPLLLTRISRHDPLAGDLAWETLCTLTRIPLALQLQASGSDTSATIIRLVAQELAYAKCSDQHAWLGVGLLRIVEMTMGVRALTIEEKSAIGELAVRREGLPPDDPSTLTRPWEVALFALCAPQIQWLNLFVLSPHGLPSLLTALDGMVQPHKHVTRVPWETVALTLRALAFLSEHAWVVAKVHPGIVASLLGVFRRTIPQKWFCILFWATDTLHNIVSHRPELTRTLIAENAPAAFATLTQLTSSSSSHPPSDRRPERKMSFVDGDGGGGGAGESDGRVMEVYKREAAKRAEALAVYVKKWTDWTPDSLPKLEPVSISRMIL